MIRHLKTLSLVSALLSAAGAAFGQSPPRDAAATPDTLSLGERERLVHAMDQHVRDHFAHWSGMKGMSYDSLVRTFAESARASSSRYTFDRAALAFTAALSNGHTRFSDDWLQRNHGQTLWLWLWPQANGWLVTASEIPLLHPGDVVTHVDGVPLDDAYTRARPYIAESGERMRRYGFLQSEHLWAAAFTLTLLDGRTVPVVRGEPADSMVLQARAKRPMIEHRWLATDTIAYVRIPRFSPNAYADSALAILESTYVGARALVIDVRENGGGNTPGKLIAYLRDLRAGSGLVIERSTIGSDRISFLSKLQRSSGAKFMGELAILTGHRCASACEDFVAPFVHSSRAIILGDTTWGSTGQPAFLDLGNGMHFQVSARRYKQADGSAFEGVGLPPHIVVPVTADALRSGRDEPLQRAVSELRAKLTQRAKPTSRTK